MKHGKLNFVILIILIFLAYNHTLFAEEKIQSVPLVNLEDLSPTFEEEKDELESTQNNSNTISNNEKIIDNNDLTEDSRIYVNLKALDKITAKVSTIRLAVGEKSFFGPLEIKALKCGFSNSKDIIDTAAYIQVKDLSSEDNNRVFLFNGWAFASNPTLRSMDHPVYDLWVTSCENI